MTNTRREPDGVFKSIDSPTFREWYVTPTGLANIVGHFGSDVVVEVPPLIRISFKAMIDQHYHMRVRQRRTLGRGGYTMRKAQVRFYHPKSDMGVTVKLNRRQLYESIWDVIDDLENRAMVVGKVVSIPHVETKHEITSSYSIYPDTALKPLPAEQKTLMEDRRVLSYLNLQGEPETLTFVEGTGQITKPILDELSMLQMWNEHRYSELSKHPRTIKQSPDLTNVVKLDEYLDRIQLSGNKEPDIELEHRIQRAIGE
jgi:hypothetical protein